MYLPDFPSEKFYDIEDWWRLSSFHDDAGNLKVKIIFKEWIGSIRNYWLILCPDSLGLKVNLLHPNSFV